MRLFAGLLILTLVSACGDDPAGPDGSMANAELRVSANVIGTPISTIVITVSAADMSEPLVFNLDVNGEGIAEGTLRVVAGNDRTFHGQAFDTFGNLTHEGAVTMHVRHGSNPPLSLPLAARSGQVPVTVTVGDYSVVVSPGSAELEGGETLQFTATVTRPDGSEVSDAVIMWATSNPVAATVDADGLVTARAEGSAQIMAVFEGIGGLAQVTVGAGGGGEAALLGPVFPPPGDVTLTMSGDGMGRASGLTWTFTDFQVGGLAALAWGASSVESPGIAFDGAIDEDGEPLAFDATTSDLAGGILVFTGTAELVTTTGTLTLPTRLTLTVSDGTDPPQVIDGAEVDLPQIGGLSVIHFEETTLTTLQAHLLAEAFHDGSWQPVLDLYDALDTLGDDVVRTSFTGGFYYMEES